MQFGAPWSSSSNDGFSPVEKCELQRTKIKKWLPTLQPSEGSPSLANVQLSQHSTWRRKCIDTHPQSSDAKRVSDSFAFTSVNVLFQSKGLKDPKAFNTALNLQTRRQENFLGKSQTEKASGERIFIHRSRWLSGCIDLTLQISQKVLQ